MTADIELPPIAVSPYTDRILAAARKQDCADPLFRILEDYARANVSLATASRDAEIKALRAEAARLRRSLLEAIVHGNRQSGRAERLEETLRPTKEKLELVASVLGEAIAAHDEMLDEVGYSPFNRRRLDEAALAVVELHATEVWS